MEHVKMNGRHLQILWVLKKELDVAGDRSVRLGMLAALEAAGHHVTLVTGYRDNRPEYGFGDAIMYVPAARKKVLRHITFVVRASVVCFRLVRRLAPDVVILDFSTAPLLCPLLWLHARVVGSARSPARVIDVRTVPVSVSGLELFAAWTLFDLGFGIASRLCDAISVITPAMSDYLRSRYQIPRRVPMGHWTSGVDTSRFSAEAVASETAETIRSKLGLDEQLVLIYHGAISLSRGLDDLVDALVMLPDDARRRIALVIVGGGRDLEALRQRVDSARISDTVHFTGPVEHDRIPAYLAAADVGVLPFPDILDWRVSSPIKLFEYLAMGKPVVVTRILAHESVLGDCPCAFWTDPSNVRDLALTLNRLVQDTRDSLAAAGRSGRSIALEHTWDHQAVRLTEIVRASILRHGREASPPCE